MKIQEKSYQSDYWTGKTNFDVPGNKKNVIGGDIKYSVGNTVEGADSIQFCEQKKKIMQL